MNKPYMTHIVCGYPSFSENIEIYKTLAQVSQYIEIQFPFSDPIADGPIISEANFQALKNGITTNDCFNFIKNIGDKRGVKNIIMTYYQVVFHYGIEKFIQHAALLGVYGILVPDIPLESKEGKELLILCRKHKLYYIPVIAPNCSYERLVQISYVPSEIIYLMSSSSTTGGNKLDILPLGPYIEKIRKICKGKKIAVGFGVKTREDREKILEIADIVVMGSILIAKYQETGIVAIQEFLLDE